MRLRHIKGAEAAIATSPYVIQEPVNNKGRWAEVFGNSNPLEIEVGMGKGRFIMELAAAHPDINFIGSSVTPACPSGPSETGRTGASQYLFYVH